MLKKVRLPTKTLKGIKMSVNDNDNGNDKDKSNILHLPKKRVITPEEFKKDINALGRIAEQGAPLKITQEDVVQIEREIAEYKDLKRGTIWLGKEIRKICPTFFKLLDNPEYGGSGWDLILSGVRDGLKARAYYTILEQLFIYIDKYPQKDVVPENILNELRAMYKDDEPYKKVWPETTEKDNDENKP